jgi:hypothetical protein
VRICESCRTRKKRKAVDVAEEEEDAEKAHKQGRLFASAIISTGLTFHKVQELFLKAEMKMPIREKQFYAYQREFVPYIASYVAGEFVR